MDRYAVVFVIFGLVGLAYLGLNQLDQSHEIKHNQASIRQIAVEARSLAIENRAQADGNCVRSKALARIERSFIARQEAATTALLAHGITFGIPREQLPGLIAQNKATEARFLGALDALAVVSCPVDQGTSLTGARVLEATDPTAR